MQNHRASSRSANAPAPRKHNRYGRVALDAVNACHKWGADPAIAWAIAAKDVFPTSLSAQKKACPRGAFLGLCAEGLIIGVPPGAYTRSTLNKEYAVRAARELRRDPRLARDSRALWRRLTADAIKHNGQLDVVVSLFARGMINFRKAALR